MELGVRKPGLCLHFTWKYLCHFTSVSFSHLSTSSIYLPITTLEVLQALKFWLLFQIQRYTSLTVTHLIRGIPPLCPILIMPVCTEIWDPSEGDPHFGSGTGSLSGDFIHSFNKHLLRSFPEPATVPGTVYLAANETVQGPCSGEASILVECVER